MEQQITLTLSEALLKRATGLAAIVALDLNNMISLMVRRNWVTAGWHPPNE